MDSHFKPVAQKIGLHPELIEWIYEPEKELIGHPVIKIDRKLVPVSDAGSKNIVDVNFHLRPGLEVLADGRIVTNAFSDLQVNGEVIRLADGEMYTVEEPRYEKLKSYRIQHNNFKGPFKGGLRFHPEVSIDLFKILAAEMTFKAAATDLGVGGGKGGIKIDPNKYSRREMKRIIRGFVYKFLDDIGPHLDIPAPDVGTTSEMMGWFYEAYRKANSGSGKPLGDLQGVVTGKPLGKGGIEGRTQATGYGVTYCIERYLEERRESLDGKTAILQGFGNVGEWTAERIDRKGGKIIAIQDACATLFDPDGLNIDELREHTSSKDNRLKTIQGYDSEKEISKDDFFDIEADIFIPAALDGVITEDVAKRLNVKLVAEGANNPTTPEGDCVLEKDGIDVIPDQIANAGGVIVSSMERKNNVGDDFRDSGKKEILKLLRQRIVRNYDIIRDIALDRTSNDDSREYLTGSTHTVREATMVLALKRLEQAAPEPDD